MALQIVHFLFSIMSMPYSLAEPDPYAGRGIWRLAIHGVILLETVRNAIFGYLTKRHVKFILRGARLPISKARDVNARTYKGLWFIDHTNSIGMIKIMLMRLRMLKLGVGKVIKQLCL